MKKKILTFLIFLATVIGAFGGITAFADVDIEECDKCFRDTVNGILEREDVEGNTLKATRSPVYDVNLEHLGFIYDFDTARGSGYAIIICDRGEYVAIEMLPQATSPYADLNAEEQYVFANVMSLRQRTANFATLTAANWLRNRRSRFWNRTLFSIRAAVQPLPKRLI